jgi:hypothetical protein
MMLMYGRCVCTGMLLYRYVIVVIGDVWMYQYVVGMYVIGDVWMYQYVVVVSSDDTSSCIGMLLYGVLISDK